MSLLACAAAAAIGSGCGADRSESSGGSLTVDYDGGTTGGGSEQSTRCEFPSGDADGEAAITTEGEESLLSESGTAMNQIELFGALADDHKGVIASGPCGTTGVLLRGEDTDGTPSLSYVDITAGAGAPEIVETGSNAANASLAFDDACAPIVLRCNLSEGYVALERIEQGNWAPSPLELDLPAVLGGTPDTLMHQWAGRSHDGSLHVVATALMDTEVRLLVGSRAGAADSAWSFSSHATPTGKAVDRVAVGADGTLHAVFSAMESPCESCNLDLFYGRLDPGATAWTTSVVQPGMWGPPHDEQAVDPSLAVDPDGKAWIAAAFERRTVTGSVTDSELRLYGMRGDAWCNEVPVTTSDAFEGADGDAFTGARPHLRIDGQGRKHIVFSDVSIWHDERGWENAIVGQVRYAVRSRDRWTIAKLVAQNGQSVSPNPLEGVSVARLALSDDGSAFRVVATKTLWETGSIYNDGEMPMTLDTVLVRGAVGLGN